MAAESAHSLDPAEPVCVYDTAIATDNRGDEVIMDAVRGVLQEVFPRATEFHSVATHRFLDSNGYRTVARGRVGVVGGTNILKSHMFIRANWRLRWRDTFVLKNVVLLGVGWQQYQGRLDLPSRLLLERILAREFLHSVRDEYTLSKLGSVGRRFIYTACPTLWPLTGERCATIPRVKARDVVLSLTYYRPDRADRELIRLLAREYENLYFWCQQPNDGSYLASLGLDVPLRPIETLADYDRVVRAEPVDVVGTRLHGGIRAMQAGRRALILAIDNRAIEMGRSSRIPIVERHDLASIRDWIHRSSEVAIRLPWDAISAWKDQFRLGV